MKIGIWQTEGWEEEYLKEKLAGHEVVTFAGELNKESLPEDKSFEAVCTFVGSEVSKGVIEALPNLKLIATRSTGYDHIDLEAAKAKGVQVANVPTYGENTVAEFAFALLLTLSRKIYQGYDRLREEGVYSFDGLMGFDLKGRTMGVVGTGNIGKHMIRMARGFEMRVIAYDAFPKAGLDKELGFEYKATLEELLSEADVVSLHVPYLPATHHIINKDNIGKFKKGAILINTARGALVETDALVRALKEGKLGGAGLDVLEEEGVMKDELGYLMSGDDKSDLKVVLENHELIDMDNVIVEPHNAFNTREARTRILDTTVENIESFGKKGAAANLVDKK